MRVSAHFDADEKEVHESLPDIRHLWALLCQCPFRRCLVPHHICPLIAVLAQCEDNPMQTKHE